MHRKTTQTCLAAFVALLIAAPAALAQDSNKALLDLLVRKHIITQQDVDSLQLELAAGPAPQQPAVASAGTALSSPVLASATATAPQAVIAQGEPKSPLAFSIGIADFSPFGFVDFTGYYRSRATGSSFPTSFTAIPYANSATGQLSETKFTAQNSRFGIRIDSEVGETKVLGYVETDFLGNAPANLGVASNSATLRMRSYFADLRNGQWELLFGQNWSLLTPNRRGISPVTSDIFYTNDMDGNYQAGLTWGRQAQVRVVYHATDSFALALSVEDPDQYVGSAVALPAAFTATEVDTGAATTQPNAFPDVVAKAAFDTKAVNGLPWHFETAGVLRSYKIDTYTNTLNRDSTAEGEGVSAGVSLGLTKELTFLGTGFYSYGGGRYIGGNAPDFVVEGPGTNGAYSIGLLKATSSLVGLEYAVAPVDTISAYWSTIGSGQRYGQQANGQYVGYGYPGSPNTNNKTLDEYTLANTYTFWRNPSYGALQVITQLSLVERTPWFAAAGAPSKAEDTMVFVDLRYVLP
jgi:hypothetical protein